MSSKLYKKASFAFLIFAFWIAVWYLLALLINNKFLLPTPHSTLFALIDLTKSKLFYKAILYSFLRVFFGVIFGIVISIFLALISYKFSWIRELLSPLITIVKATPVVTFITLLWIMLSGNTLTVLIAILMVVPIVWQNLLNGFDAIPKELSELCDVFEFSKRKRFRILIMPILMNYFFPAVIAAIGLAWKAEIAAEIIAYTKNSIGQHIYDARYHLFTDEVFAWVSVIVCFSIILEVLAKKLLRRFWV